MSSRPCNLSRSRIGLDIRCSRARCPGPCASRHNARPRIAACCSIVVCTPHVAPVTRITHHRVDFMSQFIATQLIQE